MCCHVPQKQFESVPVPISQVASTSVLDMQNFPLGCHVQLQGLQAAKFNGLIGVVVEHRLGKEKDRIGVNLPGDMRYSSS